MAVVAVRKPRQDNVQDAGRAARRLHATSIDLLVAFSPLGDVRGMGGDDVMQLGWGGLGFWSWHTYRLPGLPHLSRPVCVKCTAVTVVVVQGTTRVHLLAAIVVAIGPKLACGCSFAGAAQFMPPQNAFGKAMLVQFACLHAFLRGEKPFLSVRHSAVVTDLPPTYSSVSQVVDASRCGTMSRLRTSMRHDAWTHGTAVQFVMTHA